MDNSEVKLKEKKNYRFKDVRKIGDYYFVHECHCNDRNECVECEDYEDCEHKPPPDNLWVVCLFVLIVSVLVYAIFITLFINYGI